MAKLKINIDFKKYPKIVIDRIKSIWGAIPKEQKQSALNGMVIYIFIMLGIVLWINANAHKTQSILDSKKLFSAAVISSTGGKTGTPDFSESKSAFSSGHRISIIITKMGMDIDTTYKAINDLPREVTLAFSPYSREFKTLIDESYSKRHENIILIPMESIDYPEQDAGHKSLSSKNSVNENLELLEWATSKTDRALGVMNFMGSFFLKDKIQTEAFLNQIEKKKLMLVENVMTTKSQIPLLIEGKDLKYVTTDFALYEPMDKRAFMKEMNKIEAFASKNGHAIVVMDPYPLSMDLINTWIKGAKSRGFTLASLSSVWKNIPHNE